MNNCKSPVANESPTDPLKNRAPCESKSESEKKCTRVTTIEITQPSTETLPVAQSSSLQIRDVHVQPASTALLTRVLEVMDFDIQHFMLMCFCVLNIFIFVIGNVLFGIGVAAHSNIDNLMPVNDLRRLKCFNQLRLFRNVAIGLIIMFGHGQYSLWYHQLLLCPVQEQDSVGHSRGSGLLSGGNTGHLCHSMLCHLGFFWGLPDDKAFFHALRTHYDGNPNSLNAVSRAIDLMQIELDCCGVKSASDFRSTKWFKHFRPSNNVSVPASCCKLTNKQTRELVDEKCPFKQPGKSNPHTASPCSDAVMPLTYSIQRILTALFVLLVIAEAVHTSLGFKLVRRWRLDND